MGTAAPPALFHIAVLVGLLCSVLQQTVYHHQSFSSVDKMKRAIVKKHGRNYRMAQSLPIHHSYHLFIYG